MNEYSQDWFSLFLRDFDVAQTQREADFLSRELPLKRHRRLLDVCCGLGRHAAELAARGYEVTAVDRDANLVAEASRLHPQVKFLVADMRHLLSLDERFDAVTCLWQSFGYFDAATNERVIADTALMLDVGGRFVLDIYQREFFEPRQGTRESDRGNVHVIETKHITGDRLHVSLRYEPGSADEFEWQIFAPEQIKSLAAKHALRTVLCCSNFDESTPASSDHPRMQLVFEKC